jgi:hypothetical protein
MHQDNGHHREPTKGIHHLNAGVLSHHFLHF